MIGVYKHVVKKAERGDKMVDVTREEKADEGEYHYPYLERLFKNLKGL